MATRILRVGVIGCGEIAQVAHIPNLNAMSDRYQITFLCDLSRDALQHCTRMVQGQPPQTTTEAEELCASDAVDVVLVCSGDESHVSQGILALRHDKWALIEKPLSFCVRDIDALIATEAQSQGRVFVGTLRRYATAFLEAVAEVGGLNHILYARVRSIIGPNSNFVDQSGAHPRRFADYSPKDSSDRAQREANIFSCALQDEIGVSANPETVSQLRILGR